MPVDATRDVVNAASLARDRSGSILAQVPPPLQDAFRDYGRWYGWSVVDAGARVVLVVFPLLQLAEYLMDPSVSRDAWMHAAIRAPAVLLALTLLLVRHRGQRQWHTRTAGAGLALVTVVGAWWMVVYHFPDGSGHLHAASAALTIAIVAVSVLCAGGRHDAAWVYVPALLLAVALLARSGQPLRLLVDATLYPVLAVAIGMVIARMLHDERVRTFLSERQLEAHALTDALTGLDNRRALEEALRSEHAHAQRHAGSYAVAMADLDRFKRINDTYGHDVGDEVLREVARRMRAALRADDRLGRWGGEEFLLVLRGANETQAFETAEKLREAIAGQPIDTSAGPLSVTVSLGVAVLRGETLPERVVTRSDQALYAAKAAGRNRTHVG